MRKPVHDDKIVEILSKQGSLNAAEIGRQLNIKNGFIYAILDRMRRKGVLSKVAHSKKYYVADPRLASLARDNKHTEVKPKQVKPKVVDQIDPVNAEDTAKFYEGLKGGPKFDPRIEVLWGEVQAIDQRLDYLMAVKIHLVNRINEIKDATARSTGAR